MNMGNLKKLVENTSNNLRIVGIINGDDAEEMELIGGSFEEDPPRYVLRLKLHTKE